jgi:2-aminoethylphosphonate-pyruvate transaminase
MQGSGSFSVEACLGSVVPKDGKILIITNGAYGKRMIEMAKILGLKYVEQGYPETEAPRAADTEEFLKNDPGITHIAMVHCETTTGILNPLEDIALAASRFRKIFIVDAMSSFGGIPLDMDELGIAFLISSANKCMQGAPGFAFIIAKKEELLRSAGNARSLCLDIHGQWKEMEASGKCRYTSPTHIVRAFHQALDELEEEGGIHARFARYTENQKTLLEGMKKISFSALLPEHLHSPIITSFLYPTSDFNFNRFYQEVKKRGFVLYPGKISRTDTFRIGNIGDVKPCDIKRAVKAIGETMLGLAWRF